MPNLPSRRQRLLYHLVGVDAPDLVALQPAADAPGLDLAPRALACEKAGDDAGLGARDHRRIGGGAVVQGADLVADDDRALPRHHALVDPALGAVGEADLVPVLELENDLDRQILARQLPLDRVLFARSRAKIDLIGAQGDEAR